MQPRARASADSSATGIRSPVELSKCEKLGGRAGEHQLVGLAVQEGRRLGSHVIHGVLLLAVAVGDGIELELFPRGDRALHDWTRRGSEGSGLEVHEPGVEREVIGARSQAARGTRPVLGYRHVSAHDRAGTRRKARRG